jgi:hypothetical protein
VVVNFFCQAHRSLKHDLDERDWLLIPYTYPAKRKRALLGSNPPRNSRWRGRRPKTAKLPLAADCAHEQAPGSEVAAAAPTVEEIVTIDGNATNLVIKSR